MLTFNVTPDEMQLFIEDTDEQLQLLDQDIVLLEKEGTRPELLQEIFRAAHTLKGSSAAIGHRKMAALTHSMENVLDHLRHGRGGCGTDLIDALLQSLDGLRLLREEVLTLEDCGFDPSELVSWLTSIASGMEAPRGGGKAVAASKSDASPASATFSANGDSAMAAATSLVESSSPVVPTRGSREMWATSAASSVDAAGAQEVTVRIDEESPLPAARIFQALLEAASFGEVISSIPSVDAIESEQVGRQVVILLRLTGDGEELYRTLKTLPDVVDVAIDGFDPARAPASPVPSVVSEPESRDDAQLEAAPVRTPEQPRESKKVAPARSNGLAKTIRIDVARLDDLMNLVGELVIDRTRLASLGTTLQSKYDDDTVGDLGETSRHIERIVDELQEAIMKARMLPVEALFNRLPRVVRDLAQKSGKKVDFLMEGEETELDRSVIEELHDPLIHLLRNAVDHGIESPDARALAGKREVGTVRLSAMHQENRIVIRAEDDGGGIDPERVRQTAVKKGILSAEAAAHLSDREALELIFAPGFSTKETVSDVSGRGVGTDIVRTNIEKLNGSVNVESVVGKGTCFTLELPLTVAIMDALMVGVGDQVLAIPLVSVVETLRVKKSEILSINRRQAIQLRDSVLPLIRLDEALAMPSPGGDAERVFVVAVKVGTNQVGLVVDTLLGELQVVIKSLGRQVGSIVGVTGATILGDGRVALIIDVPSLIKGVLDEQSRGWAA
jgi:two-component system, chemotaxis family, sensor kinase CheA